MESHGNSRKSDFSWTMGNFTENVTAVKLLPRVISIHFRHIKNTSYNVKWWSSIVTTSHVTIKQVKNICLPSDAWQPSSALEPAAELPCNSNDITASLHYRSITTAKDVTNRAKMWFRLISTLLIEYVQFHICCTINVRWFYHLSKLINQE